MKTFNDYLEMIEKTPADLGAEASYRDSVRTINDKLLSKIANTLAKKCEDVMSENKDNDIVFECNIDKKDWEEMKNKSSLRKAVIEEVRELLHGEDIRMALMYQEPGRIQMTIQR